MRNVSFDFNMEDIDVLKDKHKEKHKDKSHHKKKKERAPEYYFELDLTDMDREEAKEYCEDMIDELSIWGTVLFVICYTIGITLYFCTLRSMIKAATFIETESHPQQERNLP